MSLYGQGVNTVMSAGLVWTPSARMSWTGTYEAMCKQKLIEMEKTYQVAVKAAPRQARAAVMTPKASTKK